MRETRQQLEEIYKDDIIVQTLEGEFYVMSRRLTLPSTGALDMIAKGAINPVEDLEFYQTSQLPAKEFHRE